VKLDAPFQNEGVASARLAVLDGPEIVYVDRVRSFRRDQHPIEQRLAAVRHSCRRPAAPP
jgi:DNA-binding IclR family transcriptional regulator